MLTPADSVSPCFLIQYSILCTDKTAPVTYCPDNLSLTAVTINSLYPPQTRCAVIREHAFSEGVWNCINGKIKNCDSPCLSSGSGTHQDQPPCALWQFSLQWLSGVKNNGNIGWEFYCAFSNWKHTHTPSKNTHKNNNNTTTRKTPSWLLVEIVPSHAPPSRDKWKLDSFGCRHLLSKIPTTNLLLIRSHSEAEGSEV